VRSVAQAAWQAAARLPAQLNAPHATSLLAVPPAPPAGGLQAACGGRFY